MSRSGNVWIIDDDKSIRWVLDRALTQAGLHPRVFDSGESIMMRLEQFIREGRTVGEGMSAYFTYEVTTKTSLPQYAFGQFSVTRRFRDFDWLHAQLSHKYPGVIVPPLPEKQVTNRFSVDFVEKRREQLEAFLQVIVDHPLAANCESGLESIP